MVTKGIGADWYLILKGCCPKHHLRGRLKSKGGNLLSVFFPKKRKEKEKEQMTIPGKTCCRGCMRLKI